MVEDDRGAQSFARGMLRVEEALDHRQPVALPIGQAAADEATAAAVARRLAIFDHIAVDRGLLDHVGEILLVHVGHAAVGVAREQIGAQKLILLVGRPRLAGGDDKVAVAAPVALLRLRSEEHTSELQSLMRISYAVFCLKKKKQ